MTPAEARAERAELEAALAVANESYSQSAAKRGEAEIHRGRAARALALLRTKQITGQASAEDVDEAARQVAEADRDAAEALDRTNLSYDAARSAERALDELFAEHLSAFVEDAQAATEHAGHMLMALEEPYGAALAAWEAADQAWAPLARAARVEGVPPFPVASPFLDLRRGAIRARPSQVSVVSDEEEAEGVF